MCRGSVIKGEAVVLGNRHPMIIGRAPAIILLPSRRIAIFPAALVRILVPEVARPGGPREGESPVGCILFAGVIVQGSPQPMRQPSHTAEVWARFRGLRRWERQDGSGHENGPKKAPRHPVAIGIHRWSLSSRMGLRSSVECRIVIQTAVCPTLFLTS